MFGPSVIGDLDKAHVAQALATFDAISIAEPAVSMVTLQALSNESIQHDTLIMSTAPTLKNNESVGLGVSVVGTDNEVDTNHFYEYSAFLSFFSADQGAISLQLVLGRLAAAASTTVDIVVANPVFLPYNMETRGNIITVNAVGQFINQFGIDGGVRPSPQFPIALFWRLSNDLGTPAVFNDIEMTLSLHKYIRDLTTLEPSRG